MTPLWVVAGPTASGKSALAVQWARALDAEIVSADSQQVYRHFDIGTAKPSPDELAQVPHHLVSAVDPLEPFSAARFQQLADVAIRDIAERGKQVLVVGGTGLYLRILLRGVVEAPAADPAVRAELEARAARDGLESLHRALREVDPASAERIHPQDPVRLVRALEIFKLTGSRPSELQRAHGFAERRYVARMVVLDPPRDALHASIARRTERMFQAGLVEEVRSLVERGYRDAAPMRSVGYAQALAVVDGTLSLEAAQAQTAQKTRQYAKRQLTWFRKEPGALWLTPPYPLAPPELPPRG